MKPKALIPVLLVILAVAGVTYSVVKSRASQPAVVEEDHDHESEHSSLDLSGIESAVAVASEGWETIEVTGKVCVPPDGIVKISPRIDGKVMAAYGTVGDTVRRGQVLAVISSVELAEARADYRKALARLDAARKNYERESQMVRLGAVSERPVEEARSEQVSAQGDLADAKDELEQAKSELAQADAELTLCKARLERARKLFAEGIISRQDLESAEAELKRDSAVVNAAKSKVSRAEAGIRKASANVDIAKSYLAREQKVYKGKALDTRAMQTARAELDSAKIEAQSAADRIRVLGADPHGSGETISVVSSISGTIISRDANVGQMVSPADALFTVVNQSSVWIEADVFEKDLARVRKGQTTQIKLDAYPGRVFSGKVDSISDILSAESRTAKVRCTVANSGGLLRGEMFAKISIVTARRPGAVLIPREAVLDDGGKKIVFTPCMDCEENKESLSSDPGEYDKVEVTTGTIRGDRVEILKGLEAGTTVITTGAHQLKTAFGSTELEAGCCPGD